MSQSKYVFSTRQVIRYRFPTHVNDLVIDRAETETSEVFIVELQPGGAPPLHVHHDTEQIFYVLEGTGALQIGETSEKPPVNPGDVVRIPPHVLHRIFCGVRKHCGICALTASWAANPKMNQLGKVMCERCALRMGGHSTRYGAKDS